MTPTARSLRHLRQLGMTADVTEKWVPRVKVRRDLFGFADLIGIMAGAPMLAVQATTMPNSSTRIAKILAEPRARTWLLAGGRIEVWGWARRGKRGKRKLWTLSRTPIVLEDFVTGGEANQHMREMRELSRDERDVPEAISMTHGKEVSAY